MEQEGELVKDSKPEGVRELGMERGTWREGTGVREELGWEGPGVRERGGGN